MCKRSCWESCKKIDLDEVFAYETIKVVRVKDRYLGILRLLLLLGIFLYIVVFVLILQKKYLLNVVPVGTTYTSLLKPPGIVTYPDQYPYCSSYNDSSLHLPAEIMQLPCIVWDESEALFPADELDAMMITTRVTQSIEQRLCAESGPCAEPWVTVSSTSSLFLAGINNYTIKVEHSFQAIEFYKSSHSTDFSGSTGSLTGNMVDQNGNVLQSFGQGPDIITLDRFLQAAGITLGAAADYISAKPGESKRSSGVVLLVALDYENNGSPTAPTYQYRVSDIPGSEYKSVEVLRLNDTFRLVNDRHGVKLVFLTTGAIGVFDFQTTLVQLVSALGLLSVGTLVVEMFMLYIAPHRKYYNKYKYEETLDFSDVRDVEESVPPDDFSAQMHTNLSSLRRQTFDASYQSSYS